jgi:hypothetical protein
MSSSLGANHSQPHRRVAVALGLPVTKIPEAALELVRTVEITGNFRGCNNFLKKVWAQSRYEGNELLREKIFLDVLPNIRARIFGIQLRQLTQDFLRASSLGLEALSAL